MPKTYNITETQKAEIYDLIKKTSGKKLRKRLEVLRLRAESYSYKSIVEKTKYSLGSVGVILSLYFDKGISYFKEHHAGGHNRYISFDEETQMLSEFEQLAKNGNKITVQDIKKAYDKKCGCKTNIATVQNILKRHKWREVYRNISFDKEAQFLAEFEQSIQAGDKITAYDIKNAYEKKYGQKIGMTTIYKMLRRHEWPHFMPYRTRNALRKQVIEEYLLLKI